MTPSRRAAALLSALLLAAACASGKAAMTPTHTTESKAAAPVTLAIGESASFDAARLSVKFLSVAEDSRCPKGEQCIRAGNARVELEARIGTEAPRAVALNTTEGQTEAEIDNYVLRLDGLAPVPVSGRTISLENYRVTLSVR
ncbi:MAG TPA: hypothetical protein VH854_06645 [Thermoanaerobaculia bacterium]|nr:hypothetical protein [Thermoanaerobaculia bacterium]